MRRAGWGVSETSDACRPAQPDSSIAVQLAEIDHEGKASLLAASDEHEGITAAGDPLLTLPLPWPLPCGGGGGEGQGEQDEKPRPVPNPE